MWDISLEDMKDEIEEVYDLMREVFVNIPIYPILGNHDAQNM
jgi:DNA repair exonuclease SbcCD nuclease subunit